VRDEVAAGHGAEAVAALTVKSPLKIPGAFGHRRAIDLAPPLELLRVVDETGHGVSDDRVRPAGRTRIEVPPGTTPCCPGLSMAEGGEQIVGLSMAPFAKGVDAADHHHLLVVCMSLEKSNAEPEEGGRRNAVIFENDGSFRLLKHGGDRFRDASRNAHALIRIKPPNGIGEVDALDNGPRLPAELPVLDRRAGSIGNDDQLAQGQKADHIAQTRGTVGPVVNDDHHRTRDLLGDRSLEPGRPAHASPPTWPPTWPRGNATPEKHQLLN